jgi:hypothetical protein
MKGQYGSQQKCERTVILAGGGGERVGVQPEDGGSKFLQNVDITEQHYTVS